jgi:septal ring factor EnvC (AmiA/AmiB activator)
VVTKSLLPWINAYPRRRRRTAICRGLDMLKQERIRETWLLKNDLRNLEKANSKLQEQLEEQKKVYQEQLKEQKKAHQGKPLLPSSTYT